MCSGCSGYFEDGDELEFQGIPEDREAWIWGSMGHWSCSSADDVKPSAFERDEDYEVLVSAERIVERLTIRTNCLWISQKVGGGRDVEGHATIKHSQVLSDTDYQTQGYLRPGRIERGHVVRMYLIYSCLALSVLVGLAYWLTVR